MRLKGMPRISHWARRPCSVRAMQSNNLIVIQASSILRAVHHSGLQKKPPPHILEPSLTECPAQLSVSSAQKRTLRSQRLSGSAPEVEDHEDLLRGQSSAPSSAAADFSSREDDRMTIGVVGRRRGGGMRGGGGTHEIDRRGRLGTLCCPQPTPHAACQASGAIQNAMVVPLPHVCHYHPRPPLWEAQATPRLLPSRNNAALPDAGDALSPPSSGSPSEMGPTPSASKGRAKTAGGVEKRGCRGADSFHLGSENAFPALRSPASVKKPGG